MRKFLFLLLFSFSAGAAKPAPVTGTLTLRHVSADAWQADYRFSEPVDAIDFGPAVAQFRREAWTMVTPGAELAGDKDNESIRSLDAPINALRFDVRQYAPWSHNAYVPMARASDGGTAIYLGHFMGGVQQHGAPRKLLLRIRLVGLAGETTFLPDEANRDLGVYAYFGPQKIAAAGAMRTLIDPATPAWIRETLADTSAKTAAVYAQKLGRPAPKTLALIVSVAGFDKPGFSMKGGALPGQIVYQLEGHELLKDSPKARKQVQQLVAHELAHVWQNAVSRGGIGDMQPPWVHEGGAEALSLQALLASGLWTQGQVAEQSQKLQTECRESQANHAADPALPMAWREHYTCGFSRFHAYGLDTFTLWTRMMARTEATGELYSESMVEEAVNQGSGSK